MIYELRVYHCVPGRLADIGVCADTEREVDGAVGEALVGAPGIAVVAGVRVVEVRGEAVLEAEVVPDHVHPAIGRDADLGCELGGERHLVVDATHHGSAFYCSQ